MFSGGIFAFKLGSDDMFICSDGVEMNQKELLSIVRAVMSLIFKNPLESNHRKVLYIEAASTMVHHVRGLYFGVSTRHSMSIPVLSSHMNRILDVVDYLYRDSTEISLSQGLSRSLLFHSANFILTGHPLPSSLSGLSKIINTDTDVSLNTPSVYSTTPIVSGSSLAAEAIEESRFVSEASTNASTYSSLALNAISLGSVGAMVDMTMGCPVEFEILQEVRFNEEDGHAANSTIETRISAAATSPEDYGNFPFSLEGLSEAADVEILDKSVKNPRQSSFICVSPHSSLSKSTDILLITEQNQTHDLPFSVSVEFLHTEENAKAIITLSKSGTSASLLSEVLIGIVFDCLDEEQTHSQDSELKINKDKFLLSPLDNTPSSEIVCSFWGSLKSEFRQPSRIQVKCCISSTLAKPVRLIPGKESRYVPKIKSRKVFVSRSELNI